MIIVHRVWRAPAIRKAGPTCQRRTVQKKKIANNIPHHITCTAAKHTVSLHAYAWESPEKDHLVEGGYRGRARPRGGRRRVPPVSGGKTMAELAHRICNTGRAWGARGAPDTTYLSVGFVGLLLLQSPHHFRVQSSVQFADRRQEPSRPPGNRPENSSSSSSCCFLAPEENDHECLR